MSRNALELPRFITAFSAASLALSIAEVKVSPLVASLWVKVDLEFITTLPGLLKVSRKYNN